MPTFELHGKVALVTGGARGIGFATCKSLIARGAKVVVVDLHQEDCDRAASQLHDEDAIGIAADVTDKGALQRAVAQAVERFGGIDVVVANAGVVVEGRDVPGDDRARRSSACSTSTRFGVVRTVDAALSQIVDAARPRRRHRIDLRVRQRRRHDPYAMSKAAVEQFGRALRVELAPARRERDGRLLRLHRHRDGPPRDRRRTRSPTGSWRQRRRPCASGWQPAESRARRSCGRSSSASHA